MELRRIKFRGKRCKDGRWVFGSYVESHSSWRGCKPHKSWIVPSPMTNGGWFSIRGAYPVKEETVCQYTGMQDKNGKDIYEGDVLKHNTSTFSGVVTWNSNGYFYIKEKHILFPDEEPSCVPFGEMLMKEDFVVIGNIYDNLELLKGGKE